jgi:predicted DNA-binding protein
MTAKVEYKKELFSLPVDVVERLKTYAQETHKKKSHIVAKAIDEYVKNNERKRLAQEFKLKMGIVSANTPDIQVIKANRND